MSPSQLAAHRERLSRLPLQWLSHETFSQLTYREPSAVIPSCAARASLPKYAMISALMAAASAVSAASCGIW